MKIHCPQCGKHYRVDSESSEVKKSNDFLCRVCNHSWTQVFREEKGSQSLNLNSLEVKKNFGDPIKIRLQAQWQNVIEDFENPEQHKTFIHCCENLNQLPWAKERYEQLGTLLGEDSEVNHRLQQIQWKLAQSFFSEKELEPESSLKNFSSKNKKIFIWAMRLIAISLVFGLLKLIKFKN